MNKEKLMAFRNERRDEETEIDEGYLPKLERGDFVRVRLVALKKPEGFKSHLAYKPGAGKKPNSWSKEIFKVLRINHMRVSRKNRYWVSDNAWYDRWELQKIPANTENTYEYVIQRNYDRVVEENVRHSSRLSKKPYKNWGKIFDV